MYTRRFDAPPAAKETEPESEAFRLPEHYSGNTFRQETEKAPQAEDAVESTREPERPVLLTERTDTGSPFSLLGTLSPDLLLILLAFLLMGEEGNDDISAILLFLLLV